MASALNEDSVEKKLRTVTNTQDSIQTLSLWIIHHKANHAKIVELWMRVLQKSASPAHRLTLFYLCNDVVQNCKKKKAFVYNNTFKECLREAASLVRDPSVKGKVERIFNIWGERGVYDTTFIKSLHSVLNGQQVKSYTVRESVKEEAGNRPVSQPHSQPHSQPDVSRQAELEAKDAAVEQQMGPDAEESARILAEFKPQDMIDQVTAFLRQEVEIKSKATKLSHLKIDGTSLEAVKQLKDRAVGSNFSRQCDEACALLDDLIKRQTNHTGDLQTLLDTLSLSETFYEEQYREAKIVANAYRNFGARINNMKKKLDELIKSFPDLGSPIPSPDVNAPSPENTPPFVGISDYSNSPPSLVNYSNSPPSLVNYSNHPPAPATFVQGLQQKSWLYGDTKSAGGVGSITEDMGSFPGSPLVEAPSPEGSPPDLNLEASGSASGSLESRLASFFNRDHVDTSLKPPMYTPQHPLSVVHRDHVDKSKPPVYTPQHPLSVHRDHVDKSLKPPVYTPQHPLSVVHRDHVDTSSKPPVYTPQHPLTVVHRDHVDTSSKPPVYTPQHPLTVVTSTRPSVVSEEDGSTTPLDDEAPTTPVQDEHLASPPKPSPPPKKENPIDFLSRLISQTQTAPPVKSGTQSFLDSLTMLTMVSKKPETSIQKPQIPATHPPWAPWNTKSTDNTSSSQPSSPSSYIPTSSLPSSPETFPSVVPMVPPPMPLALPPLPALSMGLSMPPPPPPFVLPPALTPNFTTPPPNFQQTSPGQKENWPDRQHSQTTEHANSIRATHSSVLKELVAADGVSSKAGPHGDHSAMDIGSHEGSNATLRSNAETVVDANTELGQQKTAHRALKSRVFVPNPERPNLMTLTLSDDLDEADMIDDDTVVEEPTWSDKSDVSGVRSRSPSRDKDTSFQHPQMDNWSHGDDNNDADSSGLAARDSNPISSISSVVKKVEPLHRNNGNNNDGEKFNERFGKNNNYWRQIDRKYDQIYKRGYRGRGNFQAFRGNRGSKDGVQAYTQAYKEAFQQYSQAPYIPFFPGPPPMNPRQPGYGQY